eukprot:6619717-Pyramimonas_sp.AAC.1
MVQMMDMPIGTTTTRSSPFVRSRNTWIRRKIELRYTPSQSPREVAPAVSIGTASSPFDVLAVTVVSTHFPNHGIWDGGAYNGQMSNTSTTAQQPALGATS